MKMNYEVVQLGEKKVAGIQILTTNENGQAMADIGRVWGKFLQQGIYSSIPDKINSKSIGLYTDYEGDFTKPYNFVACCEIGQTEVLPDSMVMKTIPAGAYAKFIVTGQMQKAVGEFWSNLWSMELSRKYSCDFEEYQNNSEDVNNQEIHIYIALK
ncbi:MAG: AraC family transcriptional regulator [Eubacterium sp.]|jgi:predicted transcriptional regulator YdeE|nr:AraC family transcriptional regulator [Eubacterium sp.]